MRSKQYAKYYLLLEQVFKNYQEYQIIFFLLKN
jgi:hypothetical protein